MRYAPSSCPTRSKLKFLQLSQGLGARPLRKGVILRLVAGGGKRKRGRGKSRCYHGKKKKVTIRTLSRYQLLEEIGRGNMGVVYRARDPVMDRTVAIKVIRLGFSLDDPALEPERFREYRSRVLLQGKE